MWHGRGIYEDNLFSYFYNSYSFGPGATVTDLKHNASAIEPSSTLTRYEFLSDGDRRIRSFDIINTIIYFLDGYPEKPFIGVFLDYYYNQCREWCSSRTD